MVKDVGVQWVIIGHSERRNIFGESSEVSSRPHPLTNLVSVSTLTCLHIAVRHTVEPLSNQDTNGAVIVSEVSSFQSMQEWYLGWEKVSCLERCPHFRG